MSKQPTVRDLLTRIVAKNKKRKLPAVITPPAGWKGIGVRNNLDLQPEQEIPDDPED